MDQDSDPHANDPRAVAKTILDIVKTSIDADKAEHITVIDLEDRSSVADFQVIASGSSSRHVGAMTQHVVEKLKAAGLRPVSVEGDQACDWVLIDCGDVLVHLMRPDVRAFYALEKMWGLEPPKVPEIAALT